MMVAKMTAKLDVDSLRALKAVADHGGVTKAAQALALSQSAVSHKIKRLEDNIDSALLARRPGGPLLTETGERLLAYANRILALHDEAVASISKRTLTGTITLGMTEDMTSSGLARVLARFGRLFPSVAVRTHVRQSLILQKELEEGAIDLGIMQVFRHEVRPDDSVLFGHDICWVKARDFDLPVSGPLPFLAYDDHCFYKQWLLEHAGEIGRPLATVLECTSNGGIIAAVEAGLGVSIVNERHVSDGMDVLSDGFPDPPAISYIVRKAAGAKSNAVRVLAEEIVAEAAERDALKVA